MYVVRQDGLDNAPQPVRRRAGTTPEPVDAFHAIQNSGAETGVEDQDENRQTSRNKSSQWHTVHNPFKRKRTMPPAEVSAAMRASQDDRRVPDLVDGGQSAATKSPRRGPKGRLSTFVTERANRTRQRSEQQPTKEDLPWTVIPAQPRGAAAWSPAIRNVQTGDRSTSSPSSAPESRPSSRSAIDRLEGRHTDDSPVHRWASRILEEPDRTATDSDEETSESANPHDD